MPTSSPRTVSPTGWRTDPPAAKVAFARGVLAVERVLPRLWPALGFIGFYLALALTGLFALAVNMLAGAGAPTQHQIGHIYLTDFGAALYLSPLRWVVMLLPLAFVLFFSFRISSMAAPVSEHRCITFIHSFLVPRVRMSRYSDSTRSRAHGVRRRNLRLEDMLGSWVKQRMSMRCPSPGQP